MTKIEVLFGIKDKQVKKTCVLAPFIFKIASDEFRLGPLHRGKLYTSANNKDFTVIHTGMNAGLTADAALYLESTPCENIILFGSCGLTAERQGLETGSLVSPSISYSFESFSRMLLKPEVELEVSRAHKELLGRFLNFSRTQKVKEVTCCTVSSLKLEEERLDFFTKKAIDVLDMESSALFAACHHVGIKAIALFYISDIVNKVNFYAKKNPVQKLALNSSIKEAARLLCSFIKENLTA